MSEEIKLNEVDDFFDLHYFSMNKKFQIFCGLWPLETGYMKYFKQGAMGGIIIANLILFLHALRTFCGTNLDFCCENTVGLVYCITSFFKLVGISSAGGKFTGIYKIIARNWRDTTDEIEYSILEKYARISKMLTRLYIVAFLMTGGVVTQAPAFPLLLNYIIPLNESRKAVPIVNTDYSITPYTRFAHEWVHWSFSAIAIAAVFIAIDATFVLIVFQILATFEVVKQRIRQASSVENENSEQSYGILVKAVKLHKDAIEFLTLSNEANSLQFLVVLGGTIFNISFGSLAILSRSDAYADFVRIGILQLGYLFQLLVLCLLGELIISSSSELFVIP
ncbi:uncharacterized protein LOC106656610 [Trichogramma pretiosum]|uniref:uncharacterized protein LOC106656610 n=1 Tax=Trichogramma pretiosum TaxID=7493 RepID=UPI000C71BE06|nr:uncharacterized protein LOC106656610 [Trichogramma pretiosum]